MISSQKRDGVWTFNMHINPLLSVIVDNNWRKDSLKDLDIIVPAHAKNQNDLDISEGGYNKILTNDKNKEWNDIGLHDLLGKFVDSKENSKKDIGR